MIIGTSGIYADINHIINKVHENIITSKGMFDRFYRY